MRIKLPAICFPAICFLCPAAFLSAAQPSWELAPPDAKILLGVDVRGLRNSSLSDSITPQMRAQMQAPMAMLHVPRAELLDDIDSVFLASTASLSSASKSVAPADPPKAGAAGAKASPAFVLVITGTFPDEHLRPLLKGAHPSYKGINVYRGTGADPTSVAVLDEHTILMGDDKSIYRAIDRKTTGVKAQGPLLARARELAGANEIWIVARDSSGALQKATGPAAMFASEIEGLDLGLAVRDGFNMDISLATKSEAGAEALAQLLATQMQSAGQRQAGWAESTGFLAQGEDGRGRKEHAGADLHDQGGTAGKHPPGTGATGLPTSAPSGGRTFRQTRDHAGAAAKAVRAEGRQDLRARRRRPRITTGSDTLTIPGAGSAASTRKPA